MLKTVSSITNAIGALNYKGTWNANTNSPALASGVGTKGDYYVVSVAGSTALDGISTWYVGDWAAFNGTAWQRLEGGVDDPAPSVRSNSTTGLLQITGPAAGQTRVMTTPDANFTAARTDAAQTFSGLQTFEEAFIVDGTAGAPTSAEITRSINAGFAVASARGTWAKAAAVGGAQYIAYKNGSINDYLVWDLVLENCSQIVCDLFASNQADGVSRTISSEYSTDGGSTWTALGSATFGASGGTQFGGTVTFNAPNSLIYFKVRAFWASGAVNSNLIGIRIVQFKPTCTNHSFAKSLG